MFWIIIVCFVILIALAVVIYFLPANQVGKRKKKKDKKPVLVADAEVDFSKDWKSIAQRWEKHNQSLLGEIEKMKMDQKRTMSLVDERKAEAKELVEKLALEKSWREKEQESIEKLKISEKKLKDQVHLTEYDLEKEHSSRLRVERELQEMKVKYEQVLDEKRQLSIKAGSQQSTLDSNIKEIRELKRENAQLKEKREDIQWVAKSEFDELKKAFALKEQELARLKTAPSS